MSPLPRVRARRRFDVERPLVEGTIAVGGARLGFAEFGDPGGRPVVWMHGTPGARRQLAPLAKGHAATAGVRVIGLERPGVGWSSPQRYQKVVDFADDVERVADALQLERFGVVGLSGGGPYALACAHRLGERVAAVGVLGGVAPAVGDEAPPGGATALAPRFSDSIRGLESLLGPSLRLALLGLTPAVDVMFNAVYRLMGEGDQHVFDQPGMRDMFIDDMLRGIRSGGLGAALQDVVLFGRDWGFRVGEVTRPVYWWHGVDDSIVPFAHGRHMAELLPSCTFTEQAGGAHLSGYLAADAVLDAVAAHL